MTNKTVPGQLAKPDVPFFQSFQKEMNDLLERFNKGTVLTGTNIFSMPLSPAIDIAETDDRVEITIEVPGVSEDDIDATIVGDVLTLKGEKSAKHEEKEKDYHLVERRYGSFRRQIPLGFAPDAGAVEANFADGVLTLKIAKPAKARDSVQKITIRKS